MITGMVDMGGSGAACTRFAAVERVGARELERQYLAVRADKLFDALMQATPDYVLLVNSQRQIVTVNRNVLNVAGAATPESLLGKRPGEAFNCIHSRDTSEGCGTGTYCSVCGGMQAILDCQETGNQAVRECHVNLNGDEQTAIDLLTVATPITIGDTEFIVLVMRDISSEKRRELLERFFFHDVINSAGGIYGLACMLAEDENLPEQVQREHKNWLVELSEKLLDDIRNQRKLLAAEKGEFVPECANMSVRTVLTEVLNLYRHHEKAPGRVLQLADGRDYTVFSDASVVRRIIGNMTINALEATQTGGAVTLSARSDGSWVTIEVHNPGEMAADVQLQLFNRSFSTKAASGRGIGTYCMKLFGERYLKGRVSFRSNREEGTVFSFSLPAIEG